MEKLPKMAYLFRATENRPHDRESTSFDNDCKFTYSFTAHMHEIP
eukprot:COSAG05_NODE_17875_length_317_cov_17.954128_1_plen_44_part_10